MNSVKDIFDKMSIEHRMAKLPQFDPSTINIESESVENRSSWISDKYKIYETYQKMAKIMDSKGCPGSQYFDYYSILILRDTFEPIEAENLKILLKYDDFSFTLTSAIVAPALASGKTVVVKAIENKAVYFIKLLQLSGLPCEMFYSVKNESQELMVDAFKTIYIGDKQSFSSLLGSKQKIYTSLTYLEPQQTGALLLETCDMEAAVDSIITSTWVSSDLCSFLGVSTVVVQQAVLDKFLGELKTQLKKFNLNYNHSKFCIDEAMIKEMKTLIETAQISGAEVITNNNNNNNDNDNLDYDKWKPTVLLNHNRKLPSFCKIINVLTCRTPNEGIKLLNDHSLETGISVWTENPSLAMELASNANCYHIWVNCHGCISPNAPLYTCRYVLGGEAGLHQCMERNFDTYIQLSNGNASNFEDELTLIESTKESMKLWQKEKNKIIHLKNFIGRINKSFDLSLRSEVLQKYLESPTSSPNDNNPKHYCIEEILPIGLVAIYIHSKQFEVDVEFVEMVLTVLGRGNGIIFFGPFKPNLNDFVHAIKSECKNVPISVQLKDISKHFLSSSHFQDFWTSGNFYIESIGPITNANKMTTRCYKSKIIWIPKIDQFP